MYVCVCREVLYIIAKAQNIMKRGLSTSVGLFKHECNTYVHLQCVGWSGFGQQTGAKFVAEWFNKKPLINT